MPAQKARSPVPVSDHAPDARVLLGGDEPEARAR